MRQQEILELISKETGLKPSMVKKVINVYWETISTALKENGKVELKPYLKIEVVKRKPRKARNPQTGEIITIPERMAVKITPYSKLNKIVKET